MAAQKSYKSMVCPFCSLHCDDLIIETSDNNIRLTQGNPECGKKISRHNINSQSRTSATINKKKTGLTEALKKVKKIIEKKSEVLILNHGTDLSGLRSLLTFASKYHCIIDHITSKFLFQNIGIVQRTGYIATSLMETKNRADTIIIFGNNILKKNPRLLDRILIPDASLCVNPKKKNIILVGSFDKNTINSISRKSNAINVRIKLDNIPDFLKIINNNKSESLRFITKQSLVKINSIIKKSKYLVSTWTASDFSNTKNPEDIISSISKFIVDLNITSRAACMPISGPLADSTSAQALTWLTGFPSRIKYSNNSFKHNRTAYNSEKLIENKQVDTVIHVSNLSENELIMNKNIYNIVLGHPNSKLNIEPDIFIPIGIPGLDHEGIMFRTDNVVSVALKSVRKLKLPSTQTIFNKLI